MSGKVVIFSAPSGSGKTTIVRHLLSAGLRLEFSVSATSRSPRENEVHGQDYWFLSPEEFRIKIEAGDFIEWEEVYPGKYYGTLRSELERIWEKGNHVLFDVDVAGGLNLKKKFGQAALAVFVGVPSPEVLEERLRARSTEDETSLKTRLGKAMQEMKKSKEFDLVLVNDRLAKTLEEAEKIVREFLTKEI